MTGPKNGGLSVKSVHAAFATAAVLIVGSAGVIGVIPAHKAQQEQRAQRSELLSVNENLDAVGAVHSGLEERVAHLQSEIDSYGYVLTPVRDLNRRLAELTTLFESHELTIGSLQPQAMVEGETISHVPIRVEVMGSLDALVRLLGTLEDRYPDLHLDALTLEFSGPETLRLRTSVRWLVAPE